MTALGSCVGESRRRLIINFLTKNPRTNIIIIAVPTTKNITNLNGTDDFTSDDGKGEEFFSCSSFSLKEFIVVVAWCVYTLCQVRYVFFTLDFVYEGKNNFILIRHSIRENYSRQCNP